MPNIKTNNITLKQIDRPLTHHNIHQLFHFDSYFKKFSSNKTENRFLSTIFIRHTNCIIAYMHLSRVIVFRLVFIIGLANAMMRPIQKHISEYGIYDSFLSGFGISFIVWFAIYCSLDLLRDKERIEITRLDMLMICMCLSVLCIPSTFLSWIALAIISAYASFFASVSGTKMRNACLIMLALSLRVPISDIFLKLSADAFLQFDAFATLSVVRFIDDSITRHGNILIGPQGHELLIMTGCASFTNISLAILLWFTVVRAHVSRWKPHLSLYIIPLCALVMGANIFRLSMMTLSVESYHFYHDELGADLVNGAILIIVLILSIASIHFVEKSKGRVSNDL